MTALPQGDWDNIPAPPSSQGATAAQLDDVLGTDETTKSSYSEMTPQQQVQQDINDEVNKDSSVPNITLTYDPKTGKAVVPNALPAQPADANDALSKVLSTPDTDSSEEEVMKGYGYNPALIKSSNFYSKGDFDGKYLFTDPKESIESLYSGPIGTLLKGAYDAPMAVAQAVAHAGAAAGITSPADAAYLDLYAKALQDNYDRNWKGRIQGQTQPLGEALLEGVGGIATLPLPGGAAVKGLGGLFKAAAKGVTIGAAAGALGQPVTSNTPIGGAQPDNFAQQKLQQAGMGAVTGGLVGPAAGAAGGLVVKGANAAKGILPDAQAELRAVAEKYGLWDKMDDARGALKQYSDKMFSTMQKQKFNSQKDIENAAGNPSNPGRQGAAQQLLARMKASPDTYSTIKTSAGAELLKYQIQSDKLYSDVQTIAGKKQPQVATALKAIDEVLTQHKGNKTSSSEALMNYFQDMKEKLTDHTQPNGYMDLRLTSSSLRDAAKRVSSSDSSTKDSLAEAAYNKVRGALKEDLSKFENNPKRPDLQAAAQKANDYFTSNVVPLKAKELTSLYKPGDENRFYEAFTKDSDGIHAQKMYNALDDKGRAAVRYGMVKDAIADSTDKRGGIDPATGKFDPEMGTVDPQKFSRALGDMQTARGVFFKGNDKFELDGLQNLMNHVKADNNSDELDKLAGVALAHGGLRVSAVLGAAKVLLTSAVGKGLLQAASDVKSGTPAMAKIFNKAMTLMPQAGGSTAGDVINRQNRSN